MVAHLAGLEQRTGRTVVLALEPEPACYLESTDDTIAYFTQQLHSGGAARTLAALARVPVADAHGAVRRHVGIVYDICHQAVGFEDIATSLGKLVDAGVPIFKLQEASAVRVPVVTPATVEDLGRFAESIYLTQTKERRGGSLNHFLNLEDAFAAWRRDPGPREWRSHFHVPVFLADLGLLGTTRFAIEEALRIHRATPLSSHLEVETYTWDVLPRHLKSGDIVEYVSRELEWVRDQVVGRPR
jgi:hypothetical protein